MRDCFYQWVLLLTYIGTAPFQSHTNPEFEKEVCGVARALTLKNMKLINSSE